MAARRVPRRRRAARVFRPRVDPAVRVSPRRRPMAPPAIAPAGRGHLGRRGGRACRSAPLPGSPRRWQPRRPRPPQRWPNGCPTAAQPPRRQDGTGTQVRAPARVALNGRHPTASWLRAAATTATHRRAAPRSRRRSRAQPATTPGGCQPRRIGATRQGDVFQDQGQGAERDDHQPNTVRHIRRR